MRRAERVPLDSGDVLELVQTDANGRSYVKKAVVEKFLGQGSSSLVYQVKLQIAEGSRCLTMVMKEFYPCATRDEVFVIKREGCQLKIRKETADLTAFQQRLAQFQDGYERQNELSNSDAMEVMVKPFSMASCGDSFYLLSDVHMGKALCTEHFVTMEEKLHVIVRVAEMIQILHEQGYILLDFKPENMLWIERPKGVKLLDFDSLVNLRNLEAVHAEDIRYDAQFGAPEVMRLFQYDSMSFEQKKYTYLKPRADIYCIGQLLFQLIFGHLPSARELSFDDAVRREFNRLCRKAGCRREDAVEKLWQICRKCLQHRSIFRYPEAGELADDINQVIRMLGAEPYILKKQIQMANHTIAACNVLEKYPVYQYAKLVKGCRNLDISITGEHEIRRQMIAAIASCVQMLDSRIVLRLFGKDGKEFLQSIMAENPAVKKTVTVFLHEKPVLHHGGLFFEKESMILNQLDHSMVEDALVEFHLYPDLKREEIVSVICRERSFYILCMEKDEKDGMEMARALMKSLQQEKSVPEEPVGNDQPEKVLIGVLGADGVQQEVLETENFGLYHEEISFMPQITLIPITLKKKSREYDERFIRNEIGKRALAVHTFYCRGCDEQISPEKILADYRSSDYNAYSSMRAALSITYKFGSIGLDIHSQNAPEEFWHKVLEGNTASAELLDRLVALEHRSWTAYMIFDGWDAPEDEEEIRSYAFKGKNDFKDKVRRLHPCLKASRPGMGLQAFSRTDWDNPASRKWKELDPLDHMSVVLHQIAGQKARDAREKIRPKMEEIDLLPEEMECERRVIREYESCHDYKKSDQDIVEAIPRILTMYDQGKKVERTLIKPVYGGDESLENVLGALYLEPDRLLLVPMKPGIMNEPIISYYQNFLEKRGISSRVEVRKKRSLRRYGGRTYLDLTAVKNPAERSKLEELSCLNHVCRFEIQDRKIVPLGDSSVLIYNRKVHLTVEEIGILKGFSFSDASEAEHTLLKRGDRTSPEQILRYQDIWNVCRQVSSREWSALIRFLSDIKEKGRHTISMKNGETDRYWTAPVPFLLLGISGMDKVLEACRREGFLKEYILPGKEDELPIEFVTDLPEFAECLQKLFEQMLQEPFHHYYVLVKNGTDWVLEDGTLYVNGCVSDPSQRLLFRSLIPLFAGRSHSENAGKPFQNLIMKETEEGLCFSFKYASRAVQEIFEKENNILNTLVYFKCLNQGNFDDIQMVPGYVICSGDMEICLISVQMQPPAVELLEETMAYAAGCGARWVVWVNSSFEEGKQLEEQMKAQMKSLSAEEDRFYFAGKRELMEWRL